MGNAAYKDKGRTRVVFSVAFRPVELANVDVEEGSPKTSYDHDAMLDLSTYEFPCEPL